MYPIPANATRIRYLESTGTQYVDLGLTYPISESSTRYTIKTRIMRCDNDQDTGERDFYGTANDSGKGFVLGFNGPKPYHWRGSGTGWTINTTIEKKVWLDFVEEMTWGTSRSITINGTKYTNTTNGFTKPSGGPTTIGVVKAKNAGTTIYVRMAYWKYSDDTGYEIDLVPVRVGQVGYLFDRVSGQLFGNAGTGSFVLGPDTFQQGVVPTRMMAMGVRKKQPYDADVEYIESTGTQYIDTGVLKETNTIVLARIYSAFPALQQFFGTFAASRRFSVQVNTDLSCFPYSGTGISTKFKTTKNEWHDYSVDSGTGTYAFDGTSGSIDGAASFSTTIPIFVFCRNQSGVANTLSAFRLASLTISHGSTLIRDFIPVRKGTTGYLYDRVTKRLFGNAGTGSFVLGPDK